VIAPGDYKVEVECANGCTNDDEVTVTQDVDYPTVNITPDGGELTCDTTFITLTADTAGSPCTVTSYQWYKNDVALGGETGATLNVTAPGDYKVEVECANGCTNDDEVTVTLEPPGPTTLELLPEYATNLVDTTHYLTATVYDQCESELEGVTVTWSISGVGYFFGTPESLADINGQAHATITSNVSGTSTVRCEVTDNTSVFDITTKAWTVPEPPRRRGAGGGGCVPTRHLTVDWDGNITEERLYNSNARLMLDLLVLSLDGRHSLFLKQGTRAPVVDGELYYLITIVELEDIPPLPENTVAIVAVSITPEGAEFDKDIFLSLGFDQLPEYAVEGTLTIAYYDGVSGVWVPLDSELGGPDGMAKMTLSTAINHFTIFAVLVEVAPPPPPLPAHFVASGLNIVPSVEKTIFVTKIGKSATITASVANDGGQEGTYTIELKLDGETVDAETITLGAGQDQQVSFTVCGLDYRQYEVEVAGLSGELTTSRTIAWWLIILLIVAFGLIIWGVVWGRRRRRRAAQEG
jgi:hypothetical protein